METKSQIHPDWLPIVQQFQRVFCRYFPNFEDDIDDAGGEMSWLRTGVFINPIDTVRRSKAKKDLRKLASCVRDISKWNLPLLYSLIETKMELKESDDRVARGVSEIYDFILACDEMEHDGVVEDVLTVNAVATLLPDVHRGLHGDHRRATLCPAFAIASATVGGITKVDHIRGLGEPVEAL